MDDGEKKRGDDNDIKDEQDSIRTSLEAFSEGENESENGSD